MENQYAKRYRSPWALLKIDIAFASLSSGGGSVSGSSNVNNTTAKAKLAVVMTWHGSDNDAMSTDEGWVLCAEKKKNETHFRSRGQREIGDGMRKCIDFTAR